MDEWSLPPQVPSGRQGEVAQLVEQDTALEGTTDLVLDGMREARQWSMGQADIDQLAQGCSARPLYRFQPLDRDRRCPRVAVWMNGSSCKRTPAHRV
jgi:hypothetical protein